MSNKLFRRFVKLYHLTEDLDDDEFIFLVNQLTVFRETSNEEFASIDDIETVEKNLKKK